MTRQNPNLQEDDDISLQLDSWLTLNYSSRLLTTHCARANYNGHTISPTERHLAIVQSAPRIV
jgi:hypothetical protein